MVIENIKQMRKRHEKEILKLQQHLCQHKETTRMPYMWAPGHFAREEVDVCDWCGKIFEAKEKAK